MPTFEFTDPQGRKHIVEGPEGATEEQAFQILKQRLGSEQQAPAPTSQPIDDDRVTALDDLPALEEELPAVGDDFTPTPRRSTLGRLADDIMDAPGVAMDFARGTLRDITGADVDISAERERDATQLEQAQRGVGLGGRTVVGAIPKTAAGLSDLAAMLINPVDRGLQNLFGFDNPPLLRTDNVAQVNALLDEVFPTPETLGERIVDTGGEILLTGGAGNVALANRVRQAPALIDDAIAVSPTAGIARTPSQQGVAGNLADDIGNFFANQPIKASVIEGGGAMGAATGQELSREAELGPTGQMVSTLGGGILGGLTPQGVVNLSRRTATGIQNVVDNAFSGELRAARSLQDAAADPEAAARAALEAPEGVAPARAADEPKLRAMEERVLQDDPVAARRAADELEGAERTTLDEIADQFGPTTNRQEWQQEVIVRAAPDNAEIRVGQPDEMLDDAARGFGAAYDDVADIPVSTQNVQVEGGNVSLREMFDGAASSNSIIADNKWRKGIRNFLNGLLDDLEAGGVAPAGQAEPGVAQVSSQDLLQMRSQIRAQQRTRAQAGTRNPRAQAEAEMLQMANQAVTDVLESQLDDASAAALRATDERYRDFLTVQGAVIRSGDKGLTPEALRASLRQRESAANVARGRTGELGRLAETGRDVAQTLGDPQAAQRLTRNMTPEQLQTVRADYNRALMDRATPTDGRLRGKKLREQIDQNEETLLAAGFEPDEIGQMRRVAQQLEMIQSRSPGAVQVLLEDDEGSIMRLLGAIAGSKSGSRLLKLLGGAGGAGPSLIVSQYGSKLMQNTLTRLSVDKADEMIRAAMTDRELFAALMTRPTDNLKAQADAARTIQAWLARVGDTEETEAE